MQESDEMPRGRPDARGDFLTIYEGPPNGDLDVTAVDAVLSGPDEVTLVGTHAGPIGATPGSVYVWGIDRGAGTEPFPALEPPTGEGVAFDAVVALLPDGTGTLTDLVEGGPPRTLDPSSISIDGSTIGVTLPRSLLPSQGRDFADYEYNLWPRFAPDGFDPTDNTQVSDFAPDASTFPARTGEPGQDEPPLVGTPGDDALSGTEGADRIFGRGGVDVLSGGDGNDRLEGGGGGDVLLGGNGGDRLDGGAAGDVLDGGNGRDPLEGGAGSDILEGGNGGDLLAGGPDADRVTGGRGDDRVLFDGDPFNGAEPVAAAPGAIPGVNLPDTVTDLEPGEDEFVLDATDLDLAPLSFANGPVEDLSGGANALVLQGSFAAAGEAARAIADNDDLTADAGAFVYNNSTLDINRLVYSNDLGDGGDFSVLANLTNQAGDAGAAQLRDYTANDFVLA